MHQASIWEHQAPIVPTAKILPYRRHGYMCGFSACINNLISLPACSFLRLRLDTSKCTSIGMQVDKLYFALKESPEITQQLASHVRDFALAAGWFTANTRWQKDRPEKDQQQASHHESQLGAPALVTRIEFAEPQISKSDPCKGIGQPTTVFNASKNDALETVSKSYVTRLTASVSKQVQSNGTYFAFWRMTSCCHTFRYALLKLAAAVSVLMVL